MKDIPGFEGLYAVTETGDVWSHPKQTKMFNCDWCRHDEGKWLTKTRNGSRTDHMRVYMSKNGKKRSFQVHYLVALTYIPNPKQLKMINHKDCNPMNNSVENLEWCTAKENAQHAYANGLTKPPSQKGSKNSQSRFTEHDIREIRKLSSIGLSSAEISGAFGTNPSVIRHIIRGSRWGHIS